MIELPAMVENVSSTLVLSSYMYRYAQNILGETPKKVFNFMKVFNIDYVTLLF